MPRVASAVLHPGERGERRASWHVLGQPRFLTYFAASLISNLGTWLQNTAQMLLAYQLTHSAFAVGVVTCAQFCGFLVLGPWAGTIAARAGAKRVLVASQFVSALTAAAMAYLKFHGALTERSLVLGALVIGVAFTFALPLQTAMVPRLTSQARPSEADTKAALAMNSVSYNAGRTLAPVLAVVVLASIGTAWAFALNALSFMVFAVVLAVIYPATTERSPAGRPGLDALRITLARPRILLLLVMVATVTFADDPILVLGPSLAHTVLAVSGAWPAYFLSALGLGTIVGALIPTRPPSSYRAALPLLALAASVVIFAAGITAWISWLAALVTGIAALLTGSSLQALLMTAAGRCDATRVMALWAIAWAGTKPLASLADGWLATHVGVLHAGMLLAAPALVVATLELCLPPSLKSRAKLLARAYAAHHIALR